MRSHEWSQWKLRSMDKDYSYGQWCFSLNLSKILFFAIEHMLLRMFPVGDWDSDWRLQSRFHTQLLMRGENFLNKFLEEADYF